MTLQDGFSYLVLLFLFSLVINTLFHLHALGTTWKENKRELLQIGAAFVVGAGWAWFSQHGILWALHLQPNGSIVDWLVTGLVLATGSDHLTTLQALGGVHQPPAAAAPAAGIGPEVMHVSGQVRVTR